MSLKRKIFAQLILLVIIVPAVMIFNDDYDAVHYNLIGLAYAWLIVKIHRYILPKWMVDYLHSK